MTNRIANSVQSQSGGIVAKLFAYSLAAALLILGFTTQGDGAFAAGLAYVTTSRGVAIVDLDRLEVDRRLELQGAAPRGLAVTPDGKYLLTANQKSGDVSVIDTTSMEIVRHIAVGKNPEFMRMHPDGKSAYVTYEPSSAGGPPGKDEKGAEGGTPAEVAAIDLQHGTAKSFLAGGRETEGIEFSADGTRISVANEGDDTITSYERQTGKLLQTVDLRRYGSRPRGLKLSPDGTTYVVTMENSDNLVILDSAFAVRKVVGVEKGPYGAAFDRAGKRLFVAAARSKILEVLDATTYEPIARVPVGDRCWHFSLTPDEARILVACGRSNDLRVVDAKTYAPMKTIAGLELAWGVVTYPKSHGSLDAP